MHSYKKGFTVIEVAIVMVVLVVAGFAGYRYWESRKTTNNTDDTARHTTHNTDDESMKKADISITRAEGANKAETEVIEQVDKIYKSWFSLNEETGSLSARVVVGGLTSNALREAQNINGYDYLSCGNGVLKSVYINQPRELSSGSAKIDIQTNKDLEDYTSDVAHLNMVHQENIWRIDSITCSVQ